MTICSEVIRRAANEWVWDINGKKWSNNNDEAGDNFGSFIAGADWAIKFQETPKVELTESHIANVILSRFDEASKEVYNLAHSRKEHALIFDVVASLRQVLVHQKISGV